MSRETDKVCQNDYLAIHTDEMLVQTKLGLNSSILPKLTNLLAKPTLYTSSINLT